ncbi:MAG: hypothetical protein IPN74_01800 [Haliscomenobacter sp.]|nr:hypothetical protein [Haliscomenobacter sp.]
MFLQPLDRQGILESIQGVSKDRELQRKYKNLEIAPGLAERIADDILHDRQSHQAPLLQMLLRKMWDEVSGLPAQAAFSEELYGAIRQNSLGGMLGDQLKRLAARFPREVEGGLPLDVLAFYTTSGAWVASRSRSDEELQQAYPHIPHIAAFKHALTALFLLTDSATGQPDSASRLAHDSLAPLVAGRLQASERPGQRARRILESKQHDIAQGVASFKDADDIAALEAGRPFMRVWTPEEEAALYRGKEALDTQRAREAAMRKSNFDFARTRIEEAILHLDYDLAFTKTVKVLDLNYEQEQLARLLEEIGFVFHACGQSDRAREALQALSGLGLPQYAPLAAALPGIINQPGFLPLLKPCSTYPMAPLR